jgi:cation diffusion facilitator CzcD-associated flavoprotein CzcO
VSIDGALPDVLAKSNLNGVSDIPKTNGVHVSNGMNGQSASPAALKDHSDNDFFGHAIPMNPEYAFTPRKLRVVTIGAGFSGLLMAHKFQHRFPELQEYVQHTIYEARSDVGGTWLINSYPGVQCDVPSHIYAFPFDPNPNWSHFYSSGPEIQEYIKNTVKKWNLDRDLELNTKVVGAVWEEDSGRWKLTVEKDGNQREEYCDILISAQGVLVYAVFSSPMRCIS